MIITIIIIICDIVARSKKNKIIMQSIWTQTRHLWLLIEISRPRLAQNSKLPQEIETVRRPFGCIVHHSDSWKRQDLKLTNQKCSENNSYKNNWNVFHRKPNPNLKEGWNKGDSSVCQDLLLRILVLAKVDVDSPHRDLRKISVLVNINFNVTVRWNKLLKLKHMQRLSQGTRTWCLTCSDSSSSRSPHNVMMRTLQRL